MPLRRRTEKRELHKNNGNDSNRTKSPRKKRNKRSSRSRCSRTIELILIFFVLCLLGWFHYIRHQPKLSSTPKNDLHTLSNPDVYDNRTNKCLNVTIADGQSDKCSLVPCCDSGSQMFRTDRGFAIEYPESYPIIDTMEAQKGGLATSGSGCAISRKYKFFFIHNLKVGGTTTKKWLQEALCSDTNTTETNGRRLQMDISNRDVRNKLMERLQNEKRRRKHSKRSGKKRKRRNERRADDRERKKEMGILCDKGDDILEIVDCNQGLHFAKRYSYFIWSFVRNPFSRLFSSYSMAEYMARSYRKGRAYPPFSFREFALGTQARRKSLSLTDVAHYLPQSIFLSDRNGCPVFNYVGRLESYEEDLLRVIREIEKRTYGFVSGQSPLMAYYNSSIGNSGRIEAFNGTAFGSKAKKKNKNNTLATVYSDPEVVAKVVNEYKSDFDMFGYDTKFTLK